MSFQGAAALLGCAAALSCSGTVSVVTTTSTSDVSSGAGGDTNEGASSDGGHGATTGGPGGQGVGGQGGDGSGQTSASGAGGGAMSPDVWSKSFVGPFLQNDVGISVDAAGSAIVTGTFLETMDIGGVLLKAPLSYDQSGFVVKLDAAGGNVWSKVVSATSHVFLTASAIDAAGNVVIAGETWGKLAVGGQTVPGPSEGLFVVKLDPNGQIVWGSVFGGQLARLTGMAVGAQGDVHFVGTCHDPISIGGGTLVCPAGGAAYVIRLDAGGSFVWGTPLPGVGSYSAQVGVRMTVAVDSAGRSLVGSNDQFDAAAVLLDPSGAPAWVYPLSDCGIYAVAFDAAGDALLTGTTFSSADLGGGPLPRGTGYVVSLSPSGVEQWHREINIGDYENEPWSIVASSADVIAVVGSYEQTVGSSGGLSAFLLEMGTDGTLVSSSTFGPLLGDSNVRQQARAVALGPAGDAYITGDFRGKIDVAGKTLTGVDLDDVFVARLGPSP